MRRAATFALVLVACGHGQARTDDSIAVAPKPVVAKPIEVIEGGSGISGDVAPFELAIGASSFCARLEGRVHCGKGTDDEPVVHAAPIGQIEDATGVAVSADFGCLTTRRGTVHCWGSNASAQLGAKMRENQSSDPVQVVGVANARRVFTGDEHACATTTEGALFCWGLNRSGETGGKTSWAPAARELAGATEVPGVRDVVSVAMSHRSTCAVTKRSDVFCWGQSIIGEQQQAQGHQNEQPYRVSSLAKLEEIAGTSGAYCGVRGGDVVCVGSTYALIRGGGGGDRDRPASVGIKSASKARVGSGHACALTRDGRVWCWGYNSSGELGREDKADPDHGYEPMDPQPVLGLASARDIVVGRATSCAITGPEEAWCWGLWPTGAVERTPVRVRVR